MSSFILSIYSWEWSLVDFLKSFPWHPSKGHQCPAIPIYNLSDKKSWDTSTQRCLFFLLLARLLVFPMVFIAVNSPILCIDIGNARRQQSVPTLILTETVALLFASRFQGRNCLPLLFGQNVLADGNKSLLTSTQHKSLTHLNALAYKGFSSLKKSRIHVLWKHSFGSNNENNKVRSMCCIIRIREIRGLIKAVHNGV